MAKEEVGKFLDELRENKDAMEAIAAKNPETIEDLAKITGGLAREQGHELSDEDFISFYNDRLRVLSNRTDAVSSKLTDNEIESVTGGALGYMEQFMCDNPTMTFDPGCSNRQDAVFANSGFGKCKDLQHEIIVKYSYGKKCDNRQNAVR